MNVGTGRLQEWVQCDYKSGHRETIGVGTGRLTIAMGTGRLFFVVVFVSCCFVFCCCFVVVFH